MEAEIKKVHIEDDIVSDVVMVIVLEPSKDTFDAIFETLEKAGFILRNREDRQIIIYSTKIK